MNKFDVYNEELPLKETKKEQKIKNQIYNKRRGRIPKEDKLSNRKERIDWEEIDE